MIDAFKLMGEISLKGGDKVQRQLGGISKGFGFADKKARGFTNAIGKSALVMGGAVVAGATALAGVIGAVGNSYNATMEQSQIAWATLLGDADEASDTIKKLQVLGAKTPFEFEGLDKSAKLLNMAGFEGEELIGTLTKVGDAVSAVGGNQETMQGVSMALFQMASKGKISAEEMNQLAERGIKSWELLGEGMGLTTQEVMELSQQGKLYAKDALPMLIKGMERYEGAMEAQSKTYNGLMSTIKDLGKMISAELQKPMFELAKKYLPNVVEGMEWFLSQLQEGKGVMDMLKGFIPQKELEQGIAIFDTVKNVFKTAFEIYINYLKFMLPITLKVWGAIFSVVEWAYNMIAPTIKNIITEASAFWAEHGALFLEAIRNFANILVGIFNFFFPLIKWIVTDVFNAIKGVISGAFNIIMGLVKIFTGLFGGDFALFWEGIKQLFMGAIGFIWNALQLLLFGRILGGIKAFILGGKNLLGKGLSFIKGLFFGATKDIAKNWDFLIAKTYRIFKGINNFMVNPIKTAKRVIFGVVNAIKTKFANLKLGLPKIKMPRFTVKNWSLNPANWVKNPPKLGISWHKRGGIVNRATLIGAGEAGNEAILPLEGKYMLPMAKAISDYLKPNESMAIAGATIEIPVMVDGREIARAIAPNIDREMARNQAIKRRGL
jgi:tape measure domain-containing protein